jgi:hypothetical protein
VRYQIGVLAREHLHHTTAGRIPPEHEVAERQLPDDSFEISDVILDEVATLP